MESTEDLELAEYNAMLEDKVRFAKDLLTLSSTNETFKRLVKEYTEDFAMTQLGNAHSYDNAQSIRFIEKFKARSHFLNYISDAIEEGRKASFDLSDGKEEL